MIEKLIEWGGVIFAAVGILCLFLEAFATFKREKNPKLTVVGMIFLAVSVIGFVVTELILRDKDIPMIFTILWIAFLWIYIVCNFVSAFLTSRHNKAEKRMQRSNAQNSAADEQREAVDEDNHDDVDDEIDD